MAEAGGAYSKMGNRYENQKENECLGGQPIKVIIPRGTENSQVGPGLLNWRPDAQLCSGFATIPGFACRILSAKKEGAPLITIFSHSNTRCKEKISLMLSSALN